MKLTQKRLKEVLHYDPLTGLFTWLIIIANRIKIGDIANSRSNGYILIGIDTKRYRANRLAWLYMKGYMPENQIDHKNRIRHDNIWTNLHEVSNQCNNRNKGLISTNKSGVTGVCWVTRDNKWKAAIKVNYHTVHLGYYTHFVNAVKARWKAEKKYNFPNCNTTSSAYRCLKKHKEIN